MLRNYFFRIPITAMLVVLLVSIGTMADAQKDKNKKYIETTEKGTYYEVIGWQDNVVYNPHTFTWFAWEEPMIEKKSGEMTRMIPVSAFDRTPVFSKACLNEDDQLACSSDEMQNFINNHFVDYPDEAQLEGQEGLEYVSFTLNKKGDFKGNLKVVSKGNSCEGCAEAAVDLVSRMEDMWYPAIKNGKPVVTQLTVPVRFKLRDVER
jgi:hypothetical protein